MEELNIFTTSDLPLAATISLTTPIARVNRANPKQVIFEFKLTPSLEELIEDYSDGLLKVEPQQFFIQLKYLKSKIYFEGGGHGY